MSESESARRPEEYFLGSFALGNRMGKALIVITVLLLALDLHDFRGQKFVQGIPIVQEVPRPPKQENADGQPAAAKQGEAPTQKASQPAKIPIIIDVPPVILVPVRCSRFYVSEIFVRFKKCLSPSCDLGHIGKLNRTLTFGFMGAIARTQVHCLDKSVIEKVRKCSQINA
jgi:hypothetical protein